MSSNLVRADGLLIFYCPECKHTGAVPREQIKPGPVYCGKCHANWKRKVEMLRDLTAEGLSGGYA